LININFLELPPGINYNYKKEIFPKKDLFHY
jgi:hypothetical protein